MEGTQKEHFDKLRHLIELEKDEENQELEKECRGLTLLERQKKAHVLLNLNLDQLHFSAAGHHLATFSLKSKEDLPLFTLEEGDLVSVFTPIAEAVEFPRATVYEKDEKSITVAFYRQPPDWISPKFVFQLHKSLNQATYSRMRAAIDAAEETHNTDLARFRDILFGQRQARRLDAYPEKIILKNDGLNASQKEALKNALSAADVALVHGPPGTGKTTVLVELIRQLAQRQLSVFVAAPSNTACDNILERLARTEVSVLRVGHPARITKVLREHTLDFKLALHPLSEELQSYKKDKEDLYKKLDRQHRGGFIEPAMRRQIREEISQIGHQIRALQSEIFARVMKDTQVFVGTLTSAQDKMFESSTFDVVIIDEATQATEPLSWIAMARAKKVILAGDHFQLPPTIRSLKAKELGLGISLFERFYDALPKEFKTLLDTQYRMHEHIMGFSSKMFYSDKLKAHESVRDQLLSKDKEISATDWTSSPVIFIDTAGKSYEEKTEEGSQSRYNPEEAVIVDYVYQQLISAGLKDNHMAVISAYSAQVRYLNALIKCSDGLEIDSVDGFQGREKEAVIVSLVRSNLEGELGFLNDIRRMNVAMTRAKKCLVVVGDSSTLSKLEFYKKFIEYCESISAYRTVWELSI